MMNPPRLPAALGALFLSALVPSALAQRGSSDIPDTAFEAQLEAFSLPEGARINLYAHEPTVKNPVHMNWDQQGRLWVVSSPLYPHIQPGQEDSDRIVVLEDTNRDGVADKHTVFADDLHIPTAVLPGDGGCYVANSVEVLFLRDTTGDGVADERSVVLSGFGTEDTHHLVHTFRWGPEGKIWMNQSIYIHTHLETPYGIRRLLGGGMWHFRPETRRAEVFMKGLINPWGHAFDEWGQSFLTDGAGSQGINFVFPRSVFARSPGASRILSGLNPGQPKHCGLEILSGRHLPDALQGTFAAPDFRGHRINLFRLSDNGSTYHSNQLEDLVSSTHRAFRPIDIKMGPDGAVYVADWYNPIIQHGEVDFRDPRRDHEHGRIWRISFEGRDLVENPGLKDRTPGELVASLNAPEGWTREMAMVELRERGPDAMLPALEKADGTGAPTGTDPDLVALRKIWAFQALNRFDPEAVEALLESDRHEARAAALRALYYNAAEHGNALALAESAVTDPHPRVRLWAVSVLAQLDSPETVSLALRALEDIEVDEPLDFAIWSICREHADRWTHRAEEQNPFANIRQLLFAVRALNEPVAVPLVLDALETGEFSADDTFHDVADWLSKVGNPEQLGTLFEYALAGDVSPHRQQVVLDKLLKAGRLRQIRSAGDTSRLTRFLDSENETVFAAAAGLAGLWKLDSAREGLTAAFLGADENESRARAALDGLISLGGPPTASLLETTAASGDGSYLLRSLAVIGRTRMNPKEGAKIALAVLKDDPDGGDPHGIFDTFLANRQGPPALAAALQNSTLPQPVALTGMQKASSSATNPEGLVQALQTAGNLTPMKTTLSEEEMQTMIERVENDGDPHRGESIYRRASLQCLVCHAIGGSGGLIGPDLVSMGASAPVDYIIESMLEPSAIIKEGYHTTLVTLNSGDSFAGAVAREDDTELVIRDAAGIENRVPKSEIASQVISPVSLMPPGLTAQLREDEFVDLIRFLSELGKEGEFNTPPNRYVRHWQVLQPHESTRDGVGFYGPVVFTHEVEGYQWTPFYAKVSGAVPLEEMPPVVGRGNNRYGVARSFLEVGNPGEIRIKLTGKLKDISFFHNDEEIELPGEGGEAELSLSVTDAGRQTITVAGLTGFGLDSFQVEILADGGEAQLVDLKEF